MSSVTKIIYAKTVCGKYFKTDKYDENFRNDRLQFSLSFNTYLAYTTVVAVAYYFHDSRQGVTNPCVTNHSRIKKQLGTKCSIMKIALNTMLEYSTNQIAQGNGSDSYWISIRDHAICQIYAEK
ncbi:uncharacterized protein LOC143354882 [Halictus rubicundus]|uniref:uncharacterized protein LOC143354882 n=1 Tax=Halictus rubicundus TaxID=77578 RepID=UPI0040351D93